MNQAILNELCTIIVGKNGKRIAAYGNIRNAYIYGLFADYYRTYPPLCRQTYYKYANCTVRYPHFFAQHYAGEKGYHRTKGDMMGIADNASIVLLRQIQREIFEWADAHLPPEDAEALAVYYVNQGANRNQVAIYLAAVMHYALDTADPNDHW